MKKIPPLLSITIRKAISIKKGSPIVNTTREDIISKIRFNIGYKSKFLFLIILILYQVIINSLILNG